MNLLLLNVIQMIMCAFIVSTSGCFARAYIHINHVPKLSLIIQFFTGDILNNEIGYYDKVTILRNV